MPRHHHRSISPLVVALIVALFSIVALYFWVQITHSTSSQFSKTAPLPRIPNTLKLSPIVENGLWGFIDERGQVVIAPQYFRVMPFSEGLAAVLSQGRWGYINEQGEMVIPPQYLDAQNFSESRAGVKVGITEWGFIDRQGQLTIPAEWNGVKPFSEGLAGVARLKGTDTKWGYIDSSGKLVIPVRDYVDDVFPFNGGMAVVFEYYFSYSRYYWLIDSKGDVLAKRYASTDYNDGWALIQRDGSFSSYGYMDNTGKWMNDVGIESGGQFSDGLAWVLLNGKIGYINTTGEFVIPPQIDSFRGINSGRLATFHNDRAFICLEENNIMLIGRDGNPVCDTRFEGASIFSEGLAPVKLNGLWGIIDQNGEFVLEPQYYSIASFENGLARFYATNPYTNPWYFIDQSGNIVSEPIDAVHLYALNSGVAYFTRIISHPNGSVGQIYGMVDREGKFLMDVSDERFHKAWNSSGYNTGKAPESGGIFYEGLAPKQVGDYWVYIDKNGELAIPHIFQVARYHTEGRAAVKPIPKWGYINRVGVVVWESGGLERAVERVE